MGSGVLETTRIAEGGTFSLFLDDVDRGTTVVERGDAAEASASSSSRIRASRSPRSHSNRLAAALKELISVLSGMSPHCLMMQSRTAMARRRGCMSAWMMYD